MRVRSLRWVAFFGCAAVLFGVLGFGIIQAQTEPIPADELPEGVDNPKYRPEGWTGSGVHPGKADFEKYCAACHNLNDQTKIGPGFAGLYKAVKGGEGHEGKDVQELLLDFIKETKTGGAENYSKDPYFRSVQESVAGAGVQMATRGGLPESASDAEILAIIDYILHFREVDFVEAEYLKQVRLGQDLVSGARAFKWGGPSCTGCHSIGSNPDLRGANVAEDVAHTYVLARQRGTDEKRNYADGLQDILAGDDAPAAHYWYKDGEGSHPLTETELVAVNTFFEQEARETGTERDSNYLPIFALLFAALGILVLEPGVLNILFVKQDHEFVDGPYEPEEHHGHDEPHAADEAPVAAAAPVVEEKPAEEVKAEEKSDEAAPAEEVKAQDKPDSDEKTDESEGKPDAGNAESGDSGVDKK